MRRISPIILLVFTFVFLGCATTSPKLGLRVQSLGVEEAVEKYYGDVVEIVAFAPGSGWIKMKTRDGYGLSPIISLKAVSSKDIETFNRFSESSGYPVRVKLDGDVLNVSLAQPEMDYLVAQNLGSEDELRLLSEQIAWRSEPLPRLAIYRDKDGRISLIDSVSATQFAKK
jgi:hypothetical protein